MGPLRDAGGAAPANAEVREVDLESQAVAKLSDREWVRRPAWLVVEFFRAVPVLLLMVFAFYLLAIGDGPLSSFWCVVIALTLYNGAVLAEVFRAGINAVPAGQGEAAYAIGMRKSQVMSAVLSINDLAFQ